MKLKREHQYYYQIQQQLFTTELPFCDFIVCGFNESLEKCFNPSCQISLFHPSCLKISQVPKVWYCSNCQKFPEFKKKSKNMEQNEVVLRAQEKESICVYMAKPQNGDKLIVTVHHVIMENFSICPASLGGPWATRVAHGKHTWSPLSTVVANG